MKPSDTAILNWLQKHPRAIAWHRASDFGPPFWFRVFGPKDSTNHFKTLRAAVIAQMPSPRPPAATSQ